MKRYTIQLRNQGVKSGEIVRRLYAEPSPDAMNQDAYTSETREHRGHTITVEWHYDQDMGEPWKEHDGHGIVSEWVRRDKEPGERVLCSGRYSYCYYDIAETIKLARKDGWGLGEDATAKLGEKLGRKPTRKDIIAEAVERDFEYLKRWCDNDWHWCGYVCKIDGEDFDSCWGIDSDSVDYFEEEVIGGAVDHIDREIAESHGLRLPRHSDGVKGER